MTAPTDALFDRSMPARIGVTLLNILLPGLGLIRLGHGREGGLIAAGALAASCILTAIWFFAPVGGFFMIALVYALFALIALALVLIGIVRTWPRTRRDQGRQWWSRWYAILLWLVLNGVVSWITSGVMRESYRSFYVASISMAPTLTKNEKVVADMRWRTARIGTIVMVRDQTRTIRIYRVAATGGQTFAMKNGVPIINGHAATQSQTGTMTIGDTGIDPETGRIMREHLPGETGSHKILQLSGYIQDDVPPVRIPPGSVYLLGDDRDMAADSRIPLSMNGVGILPASAIIGRPLYITWSKDHSRIGQRADH